MRILIIHSTDGRGHQSRCEAMKEQFESFGHEVSLSNGEWMLCGEYALVVFDIKNEKISTITMPKVITLELTDGEQKIKRTDYHINMLDAPLCLRKKYCKDKIKIGVFVDVEDLEKHLPDDERMEVVRANGRNWDKLMREADIRITSGGQTFLEAMQFDPELKFTFPMVRNSEEEMNVCNFGIFRRLYDLKIIFNNIKRNSSFNNAFASYLLEVIKK